MNERPIARPRAAALPTQAARPAAGAWREHAAFLHGFLRHPAQVGSVAPSSPRLVARLARSAGVARARTVVELGTGTGGTTAGLLRAMGPGARLLAIELDPAFHRHVAQRVHDPRLLLELASAAALEDLLRARGLPAPDAVVSGIPFSTLPPAVADGIAQAIARALRPGGRFVAYQVRDKVSAYASPYLGRPEVTWELVNIPPVRVFTWTKAAEAAQRAA